MKINHNTNKYSSTSIKITFSKNGGGTNNPVSPKFSHTQKGGGTTRPTSPKPKG